MGTETTSSVLPVTVQLARGPKKALRPEHLYRAIGLAFLLALTVRFFDPITHVFLLGYMAVIIAVGLAPVARHLRVPRAVVAVAVVLVAGAVAFLAIWFGLPAIVAQGRGLTGLMPQLDARVGALAAEVAARTGLDVAVGAHPVADVLRRAVQQVRASEVLGGVRGMVQLVALSIIVFSAGLMLLVSPHDRMREALLGCARPERRAQWARVLDLLGARIGGWLRGVLVSMCAVGILATITLYVLGVPDALALGVMQGLGTMVPVVGDWIAAAATLVVAFLASPLKGVLTLVALVVLYQIKGNVIDPWVMARATNVPAPVTVFVLILAGNVFGLLGILLAIPIYLLVATTLQVFWIEPLAGASATAGTTPGLTLESP